MLRPTLDLVSEKLHEQILLKSRSIYVNNDTNFEPFAFDLSMRLYETFKPFLQSNNLLPTGGDAKAWLEGLKQVFLSSLKLKSQVLLRSGRHDFRLPACDIVFDPEMMTTEEGANMEGNWTVQVALFPALIQITDPQMVMDDAVEVTMFHATVVLQ